MSIIFIERLHSIWSYTSSFSMIHWLLLLLCIFQFQARVSMRKETVQEAFSVTRPIYVEIKCEL